MGDGRAVVIRRRSARAILIDDDGYLVLIRRTKPGLAPYWTTAGGGVEDGDGSIAAAMHRELAEELGAKAIGASQVFLDSWATEGGVSVQHFFVTRLASMDLASRNGPEFDDPSRGAYDPDRFDLRGDELATIDLQPAALKEFILANREALLAEAGFCSLRHRPGPYWAGDPDMAVTPEAPTAPAPEAATPRWRRCLTPWRSPADQPGWARPALLAIAVVAAIGYGWGMAGASVEPFYGAAARSMSESWHDFIFGAFDPAGTVTVDKLPGALWMQALSLRVFGFHIWALVLPQVIEGALTVLVLYRAVRRLAGPVAGLTAAAVLAVTPVTVLLSRGNVSDSLLILLLVLAADATSAALVTGSLRELLIAGAWVGLAFQAKMIQAWLALPALAAAYLLAAPVARLRTRLAHVALAGLVTVVISLSWMTAVSLVPAQDRPYVDGSANDSVYTQVFDYNGVGRLTGNWSRIAGPPSPITVAAVESDQLLNAKTMAIKPSWHRLLSGPFAADAGWLLPAALVAALGVLIARRRQGRRDPLQAAVVLWGGWWLILAVFFSVGTYLNSYYVAALVPAVAALCGVGLAGCGPPPWSARVRLIVAATVLGCAGYGAYLMSRTASGPVVLTVVALVLALAAVAQLVMRASGRGGHLTSLGFAGLAVLLLPTAASVSSVVGGLGPFDTPFESAATAHNNQRLAANGPNFTAAAQRLEQLTPPGDALFGVDTSGLAQGYILYSGQEVLPIGGYLGNVPAPSLAALQADIKSGYVRFFALPVSPAGSDPRVLWIESHCTRQPVPANRAPVPYANFICAQFSSAPVSQPASPSPEEVGTEQQPLPRPSS